MKNVFKLFQTTFRTLLEARAKLASMGPFGKGTDTELMCIRSMVFMSTSS